MYEAKPDVGTSSYEPRAAAYGCITANALSVAERSAAGRPAWYVCIGGKPESLPAFLHDHAVPKSLLSEVESSGELASLLPVLCSKGALRTRGARRANPGCADRVDDSRLGEGLVALPLLGSITVDESSSPPGQRLCCNWEAPAGSPDSAGEGGWKRPLADDSEVLEAVA